MQAEGSIFKPEVTVFHHTANNIFIFFSCSKLVFQPISNEFVYATLSLNRVARRLLTICKKSLQRTSNSDTRQELEDVLKNKYFSMYFMLAAFMSPVKFSNNVFPL